MSILVFLLFAGSGAAALIYETVWQQLLQLVIGSSTVSTGVLLGMFMGGMCLGSLAAPRLIDGRHHPLRVYAVLEAAIGAAGLLLLTAMPAVTAFYSRWGGSGAGVTLRALVAAICLLPPTFAMGATLPAISRVVESDRRGMSTLGLFYAGNIAGAVFGCLLAGFYLLRVYDMAVATDAAAAINLVVAVTALVIARDGAAVPAAAIERERDAAVRRKPDTTNAADPTIAPGVVLIAIACSGFCALAAEVIWTRLLSLLFSATVYTFSIILAVFLIGLGIGSGAGALVARETASPRRALAWAQMASAAGIAWSALMLGASLPFWPINTTLASNVWFNFQIDFARATWAILPAPLCWGASFPLALAAYAGGRADAGAIAARVYAANTVGAIAGALGASFVLVPLLGSPHAQQLLIGVAAISAIVSFGRKAVAVAAVTAGAALALTVPPLPGVLVAYGRHAASWAGHTGELLFVGEGLHASVAVSRVDKGVLNYHNAGKVQASSQPADMRLQRMLGHLTTLVPEHPRSVLVIGCGAGVTAGAVAVNPQVEKVTIVEIEPLVPQVARRYFGSVNHDVLSNPKVHVVIDDARHFLTTTSETFDAITSDPLDPWVKGAATLYTREFFDRARAHLNRGGVMTLFVQLYESSRAAVQSEMGTFFGTFPDGMIFANTYEGRAIDTVLVGPVAPPAIWIDELDAILRLPAYRQVAQSLGEINVYSATELFGAYAGRARDLHAWIAEATLNRDVNLKLQYLAGAGVNLHEGDAIYQEILSYRRFPDDLFVASDGTLDRLKEVMAGIRE
ncbi:MAG TPA: fused MFS/spermidine synthase [Vicinamibacterales bacterium]|jgi:spermidine synthase